MSRAVSLALTLFVCGAPVVGFLFLDWDPVPVLLAFSVEPAIVFLVDLIKVLVALPRSRPVSGRRVIYRRGGETAVVVESNRAVSLLVFLALRLGVLALLGLLYGLAFRGLVTREHLDHVRTFPPEVVTMSAMLLLVHARSFFRNFLRGPNWVRRDISMHVLPPLKTLLYAILILPLAGFFTGFLGAPRATLASFLLLKGLVDVVLFTPPDQPWERNPPIDLPEKGERCP